MICLSPKQKAEELISTFDWQLAIMCVREIILSRKDDNGFDDRELATSSIYHDPHPMYYSYWKEVHKEILLKKTTFMMIYFQPPGINKKYCEVGTLIESDPDHIYYLDEPCKILKSQVKIIEKDNVYFNKYSGVYTLKT